MKCLTTIYHTGTYKRGDLILTVTRNGQRLGIISDVIVTRTNSLYYYVRYANGTQVILDPSEIVPFENGDLQSLAALLALKGEIRANAL